MDVIPLFALDIRKHAKTIIYAAPYLILLIFSAALLGCGGGGETTTPPPVTPTPDFSLTVSPSATVQAGGSTGGIGITVNPTNGFSSPVSISFQGIPTGVVVTPALPVTVSPGANQSFGLQASLSAPVGATTITVQGSSGANIHSATFGLTVTAPAPIQISLNPSSATIPLGSSTTAQLTLTGTPSGQFSTITSVQGPFGISTAGLQFGLSNMALTPTQPQTLTITALEPGSGFTNLPLTVTAQDGSNVATATFTLNVTNPFPSNPAPTRMTITNTDQEVTGAVYDPLRKLVFATVNTLNDVAVFSSVDGHKVADISVPQPFNVALSADGSQVYVGTQANFIAVLNPDSLQLENLLPGPPTPIVAGGIRDAYRPFRVAPLSNGKVLVIAQVGRTTEFDVFLWDPVTGTFKNENPPFSTGGFYALVAVSGDHSKALLGTSSTPDTSTIAIYDPVTDTFPYSVNFPDTGVGNLSLNQDGSLVIVGAEHGLIFYDGQLNEQERFDTSKMFGSSSGSTILSHDGKFLYIPQDMQIADAASAIAVLNIQTQKLLGSVPSALDCSPLDSDETGMMFVGCDAGLGFVDAAAPRALTVTAMPELRAGNIVAPAQGSLTSPTTATVNGTGFVSGAKVFIGAPPTSNQTVVATNVSTQSSNVVDATFPPSPLQGPVNVTLLHPDGWEAIGLNAFSYGPLLLQAPPNAVPSAGGSRVDIYGYGLDYLPNQLGMKIGGQAATITNGVGGGTVSPTHSPFVPLAVTTPPGPAGTADVTVTTPDGISTIHHAFQYLNRAQVFPVNGALSQVIYDRPRQRLYATNADNSRLEVFDLATSKYLTPIPVGKTPEGVTLTSDGSKIVVANFGDNTLSEINPATNQVITTVAAAGATSDCHPLRVAAIKPGRVVYQLACFADPGSTVNIFDTTTQLFGCNGDAACATAMHFSSVLDMPIDSTSDGNELVMGAGGLDSGPILLWNVNAGAVQNGSVPDSLIDVAISADGNVVAANVALFDPLLRSFTTVQDLAYLRVGADSSETLLGEKLDAAGSLFYLPQSLGVDIIDVHRARLALRVATPEPIPETLLPLALNETGDTMFLISNSGLTIVQLAVTPVSIGSLQPNSGPATGGVQITIRGNGFQNGATVLFGTTSAPATVVDSNTITVTAPSILPGFVRVTVTNPDGTQYQLDGAYQIGS